MADYVELDALKQTLGMSAETYADDDLRLAITSASAAIDSICGRSFTKDEEEQTRTYVPGRYSWIEIDDLAELGSIESDTRTAGTFVPWAAADYRLEPLNAQADGWPWTVLRVAEEGAVEGMEPYYGTVRVTGKFGWPAIPPSVREAAMILSVRLTKRVREAPFGIAGMGVDGIAVRVSSSDPDVSMLLSPYTRPVRLA